MSIVSLRPAVALTFAVSPKGYLLTTVTVALPAAATVALRGTRDASTIAPRAAKGKDGDGDGDEKDVAASEGWKKTAFATNLGHCDNKQANGCERVSNTAVPRRAVERESDYLCLLTPCGKFVMQHGKCDTPK